MAIRMADVAHEGILLAGGARAILLQVANPAVGHGVARHSDFASNPLLRLRNTLTYIYVLVYGSAEEAAKVTALVNAAHKPVHGVGYDATDPELQLWVAATLYDTALALYQQIYGEVTPNDAEAIYQEYVILGSALQMPRELWPADRAAFRTYWDDALSGLRTDEATRGIAQDLLHPSRVPFWLGLAMPLVRLVTAGLLTAEQRAMFGLPWSARRQRRYDRAMRMTTAVYPRLPARIRHWPVTYYLKAFR